MARPRLILTAGLMIAAAALTGCGKSNKQADALDNAAAQSDPAAAAELHNEADAIRDNGSDGNLATPDGSAQNALQTAGDAAAANPTPTARPAHQAVDKETGLTH